MLLLSPFPEGQLATACVAIHCCSGYSSPGPSFVKGVFVYALEQRPPDNHNHIQGKTQMKANNILETIGRTPTVRINRLYPPGA